MDKAFTKPYNQWEDLPSRTTPFTAEVMNNYDSSINEIDDRVIEMDGTTNGLIEDLTQFSNDGFLPKNLNKYSLILGTRSTTGKIGIDNSTSCLSGVIELEPSTEYTLTIDGVTSIPNFRYYTYISKDESTLSVTQNLGTVTLPYTFTTSANEHGFSFQSGSNTNLVGKNVQVEKGSQATSYTPFALSNTELTQIVDNAIDNDFLVTNIFDGVIELGGLNIATGENVSSTSRTRSANFIEVKPNTTYTITRNVLTDNFNVMGYNANKVVVNDGTYLADYKGLMTSFDANVKTKTFRTTPTTKYIRWYHVNSADLTEKISIQESAEYIPSNLELKENLIKINIFSDVSSQYSVGVGNGVTLHDYKIQKNGNLYYVYLNISIAQDLSHNSLVVSGLPKARTYMKASLDVSTQRNLLKIDNGVNMYAFGTVKACSYAVASFMYIAD